MKDRHLRLGLNKHVELFWQGKKQHADIENVSVGGVLIRAHTPVNIGDFMSVYLKDNSLRKTLELNGQVIRMEPSHWGMPAFAVKFDPISEMLRGFMTRSAMRAE